MPAQRPRGRERGDIQQGGGVHVGNQGLGTGPVGSSDGYNGRKPGGSNSSGRGSGSGGGRGSGRVKWLNTVYAGILCDNGRVVKKAVLQYYSGAKWFVKIHEGDTVVHYKWCPHTRIDRADGSMTTCVMCGAMNKTAEEHCVDCGATLMHTLK